MPTPETEQRPPTASPPEKRAKRARGMGSLYLRGKTWYVQLYVNGKHVQLSSKTSDRGCAERFLRKKLSEVETRTFIPPRVEKIRVQELFDDLLVDYRNNARKSTSDAVARWELHLKPHFATLCASRVTQSELARYIEKRRQEGAANASVNREISLLRHAFYLGHQREIRDRKVREVPRFPRLAEAQPRQGFLEDKDYRRLVEGTELWFRSFVTCARTYGWRVNELLSRRVRHLDLAAGTIRLEPGETKNGKGREAALTGDLRVLLSACAAGKQPGDPLFSRRNGKGVKDFRNVWRDRCVAAGVGSLHCRRCIENSTAVADQCKLDSKGRCPTCSRVATGRKAAQYRGLIPHDLRRTAARNLRRAGVAEGIIMDVGGWKTRSVFERYSIVNLQDKADAMRKLEAKELELAQNDCTLTANDEKTTAVAKGQIVN